MTWISYAQNYEDVTLMRALGNVDQGYYIDVGAHDPRADSVTRAFYERGWHGINIEPVARWHERLVADRDRDVNLRIAAGEREGVVTLFEVENTGLSTADRSLAERYRNEGHPVCGFEVGVRRLDAVCREHGVQEVHFLKIDAEGAELQVLRGMDFTRLRPWVVVVEATEPRSSQTSHHRWEPLLTEQRYRFVWFDGLNRFYVAEERASLGTALAQPPSVFDDFMRYTERLLRDDVADFSVLLARERERAERAEREVRALRASRSWRITAPMRRLGALLRRLRLPQASAEAGAGVGRDPGAPLGEQRVSTRTKPRGMSSADATAGDDADRQPPAHVGDGDSIPARARRVDGWLRDAVRRFAAR